MARVVIIAVFAAFLLSYALIAGITLAKGVRRGRFAAGMLLAAIALAGGTSWGIYWATKRGALSPEDFYNGVLGNAVVVGGLLAALGAVLGVLAAFASVLRRRP